MSLKLHSAFQAPSKRELAQTESPVDFPCKLSSERVTRASVLAVFWNICRSFFSGKCCCFGLFLEHLRENLVLVTLPTLYSK